MRMKQYIVGLLAAALVASCGSDNGGGVGPTGSAIQIVPSSVAFNSYRGNAIPPTQGPERVVVTVLNSLGNPVRNAIVSLYNAGNGTIRSSDRLGTYLDFQADPYVTTTDDFGNVYIYIYAPTHDFIGTRTYDFEAYSGAAYATMPISVTCDDTNTATADICD